MFSQECFAWVNVKTIIGDVSKMGCGPLSCNLMRTDTLEEGGPSGSGKTSLARKMANIVGCDVVSLESYHRSEQVKDFKYEDFRSLDLTLLSKDSPIRVPAYTNKTVS
ncbi:hypothetical protein AgCh_034711 [Apium graveolens]